MDFGLVFWNPTFYSKKTPQLFKSGSIPWFWLSGYSYYGSSSLEYWFPLIKSIIVIVYKEYT